MAVFTALRLDDADRVLRAHGIDPARHVEPIPAGSVNSNFFVEGPRGRWFLRIYEEQDREGVAYEWALLEHLERAGVPVARRVRGTEPGAVRVAGKPVALFELVGGRESCQAAVTPARAEAVGRMLARVHRATDGFGWRRAGRFTLADVADRLAKARRDASGASGASEPEALGAAIERLEGVLDEVRRETPEDLPRGVIHGDLFRDNVRWQGDRIVALIDWESASDGWLAYDLMVLVLSWCYADTFRWDLARALARGYDAERALTEREREALRVLGLGAAVRFTTTRITDFELRRGIGDRVHKDYRRFLERLEAVAALSPDELCLRLLG